MDHEPGHWQQRVLESIPCITGMSCTLLHCVTWLMARRGIRAGLDVSQDIALLSIGFRARAGSLGTPCPYPSRYNCDNCQIGQVDLYVQPLQRFLLISINAATHYLTNLASMHEKWLTAAGSCSKLQTWQKKLLLFLHCISSAQVSFPLL